MDDKAGNAPRKLNASVLPTGGLLGDMMADQQAAHRHEINVAAPIRSIAGQLMAHADPDVRAMGAEILRRLAVGK